ncbi:hypothetical protein [Rhodococcus sp. BE178]|uniref:hypothetical protein n=1 Tax=Rhodococcus sp. BE178 TaxID=2817737 RepID=UPI003D209D80
MAVINADNASVFDEGEIYILDPAYAGPLSAAIPTPGDAPGSMWLDFGLLGTEGVTYTPGVEKTFYDGWGHPRFKGKTSKGTLELSFNALERNAITAGIAYGKDAGFISVPKGIERTLLIVTREDGVEEVEYTCRPALLTTGAWTKSESGIRTFPITADIMSDADGHLLGTANQTGGDPTSWTVTVPAGTTAGTFPLRVDMQTVVGIAFDATSAAVKTALEAIVGAGNVTVTGSAGGPFTVTLKNGGTLASPSAALTPAGTVTVVAA